MYTDYEDLDAYEDVLYLSDLEDNIQEDDETAEYFDIDLPLRRPNMPAKF